MLTFAPNLLLLALAADPVTWSIAVPQEKPRQATVAAEIAAGWHLYSLKEVAGGPKPTRFTVQPPFTLAGPVKAPAPLIAEDSNFGVEVGYYEGRVEFRLPLALAGAAPKEITVQVRYQCCTDKECLPPKTVTLTAGAPRTAGK